jgi:hypothetical protein
MTALVDLILALACLAVLFSLGLALVLAFTFIRIAFHDRRNRRRGYVPDDAFQRIVQHNWPSVVTHDPKLYENRKRLP